MKAGSRARAIALCLCLETWAGPGLAQQAVEPEPTPQAASSEEVERLRKIILEEQQIIADCMKRIDALETGKKKIDSSWVSNVKLYGDFRYRYESIHQNLDSVFLSNNAFLPNRERETRDRHRIRLRLGADWTANEEWKVGVQLATTQGGDPISTNQTLTGGFSKKDVWVDLAYFDYTPITLKGLEVIGGKMKNPFYTPGKTELIWDSDLTPEGLAVKYASNTDPKKVVPFEYFATAGYFQVEERATDVDTDLWGIQVGGKYSFNELGTLNLKGGLSYYDYGNVDNYPPLFDATDNFGNSLSRALLRGTALYADDYNLVEPYLEFEFPVGRFPASVFADYVVNVAADDPYFDRGDGDDGWLAGLTLGKLTNPHTWAFRYNYRDLGRDAVIGAFTDSDFGGGGTNARGHEVGLEYQVAKNVKAEVTYFYNTLEGSDYLRLLPDWGRRENVPGDYQRLQLDLNVRF